METTPHTPKRVAVKLRPTAESLVRGGHPWVFNESIVKESLEPETGDLAIIFDKRDNKFLALGLFDCESPIRIKVIQVKKSAQINQDWFHQKIAQALALRSDLISDQTTSFRLVFGEADGLPGVICDVYNGNAVLKIYSGCWLPYLNQLCNAIEEHLTTTSVILRLSRSLQKINRFSYKEGTVLRGELENEEVVFKEHGVLFKANLIKGHKTGFFLDHRANRKRVGQLSAGKTVLDVFSYAGGFSVHALCAGAKHVVSLDISEPALEYAKINAELNTFEGFHETYKGDAFRALEGMVKNEEKFDVVIIDPPSFAKQKSEIPDALNQYARLAKLGAAIVNSGGVLILASCSSRVLKEDFLDTVEDAMEGEGHYFTRTAIYSHDIDHPEVSHFPEGSYLKCAYYRMD